MYSVQQALLNPAIQHGVQIMKWRVTPEPQSSIPGTRIGGSIVLTCAILHAGFVVNTRNSIRNKLQANSSWAFGRNDDCF